MVRAPAPHRGTPRGLGGSEGAGPQPHQWCCLFFSLGEGLKGAYRALCEKLAVLHRRAFGKFRRLKGRH